MTYSVNRKIKRIRSFSCKKKKSYVFFDKNSFIEVIVTSLKTSQVVLQGTGSRKERHWGNLRALWRQTH